MKTTLTAASVVAVILSAAAAIAAPTAEQKCEAGKNDAAGKYASCLAKAEKTYVLNGDNERYGLALGKCEEKLVAAWDKLEAAATAAGTTCPSTVGQLQIENFVDACVQSVAAAVADGGVLGSDPVTCNADLGTCTGNLGTCNGNLTGCNTELSTCDGELSTCEGSLAACESAPFCGNGVIDAGEDCDVANLGGATCATQPNLTGGSLTCAPGCTFDTSGCYAARFDASGDTILDHQTGLEWEKKTTALGSGADLLDPHDVDNIYWWCAGVLHSCTNPNNPFDGSAATDFLAILNGVCYAGHCDWRLPTIEETQALPWPRVSEFQPDAGNYWTASTHEVRPELAYGVHPDNGGPTGYYKAEGRYVRAVRSGS